LQLLGVALVDKPLREVRLMPRAIESVEVIDRHPEGSENYKLGGVCSPFGERIADIIELNGVYYFYNHNNELLMEIKDCPVVVKYTSVDESA
jgi:hypothetical protein